MIQGSGRVSWVMFCWRGVITPARRRDPDPPSQLPQRLRRRARQAQPAERRRQLRPYAQVAGPREQAHREHEVNPHPRGQQPQPLLLRTGLLQHRLDHSPALCLASVQTSPRREFECCRPFRTRWAELRRWRCGATAWVLQQSTHSAVDQFEVSQGFKRRGPWTILEAMNNIIRPPCAELLKVAEAIDQMIAQYLVAVRTAPAVGRWEAPQEGFALGWLVIRNVEAVIEMARHDEVFATAAWPNARVAFELSARIIWMLRPADRYEAECRWLAFLGEYESTERKLADAVPAYADRHTKRAESIRGYRDSVISALPLGYQAAKIPSFRDLLKVLDSPEGLTVCTRQHACHRQLQKESKDRTRSR